MIRVEVSANSYQIGLLEINRLGGEGRFDYDDVNKNTMERQNRITCPDCDRGDDSCVVHG